MGPTARRHRTRGLRAAAATVLFAVAPVAVAPLVAAVPAGAASASVAPAASVGEGWAHGSPARPGGTTKVSGRGCGALRGGRAEIRLGTGPASVAVGATVDLLGAFGAPLTVPNGWPPGSHPVTVVCPHTGLVITGTVTIVADGAIGGAAGTFGGVLGGAVGGVGGIVGGIAGGIAEGVVGGTVDGAGRVVEQVGGAVGSTVGDATGAVGGIVGGVVGGVGAVLGSFAMPPGPTSAPATPTVPQGPGGNTAGPGASEPVTGAPGRPDGPTGDAGPVGAAPTRADGAPPFGSVVPGAPRADGAGPADPAPGAIGTPRLDAIPHGAELWRAATHLGLPPETFVTLADPSDPDSLHAGIDRTARIALRSLLDAGFRGDGGAGGWFGWWLFGVAALVGAELVWKARLARRTERDWWIGWTHAVTHLRAGRDA